MVIIQTAAYQGKNTLFNRGNQTSEESVIMRYII